MVNRKAVWALVCSLLALAALGALVYLARRYDEVRAARRVHHRADRARALVRRRAPEPARRGLSTSERWGEAAAAVSSPSRALLGTIAFLWP